MSGIRISEFKKPKTIIVDQAKVDSAYGPKSSILLESLATSYSKSGFTIEVKGLSRDSLLNGMFVSIPLQVRWTAQADIKLIVSEYPALAQFGQANGAGTGNVENAGSNKFDGLGFFSYDNVCVRPNAFKCIRNATLSINGSSFSTRVDSYYTAMCKLFADGRVEDISGGAYESYPYTNSGDKTQLGYQRGWFERCRSLNTIGKVVKVTYTADKVTDIVMQYDIKFPLWFGPFTHLGFPGLTGFDGQTVSSIPYCSDLVLECTFSDDVIMDAFACSDDLKANALSVNNPSWHALGTDEATDFAPNSSGMWSKAIVGDITANGETAPVGLRQPKLCYMFSEPDPDKMQIAPIYTIPSYRLITYEDRVPMQGDTSFAATKDTVLIQFPYIRLSNISSLYIAMAEPARVDIGSGDTKCIGQRSGRYSRDLGR
jgi:hypothetical protein